MYYRFKENVYYIPDQVLSKPFYLRGTKMFLFTKDSVVRVNDQGFMEHENGTFNIEPFEKYLEFSK